MKLSHTRSATSAVFDDPNLVSSAGLVPVLALADSVGLRTLADQHLSVPGDKGANAGLKVASLVAGMVAGADSIDDMALLRHGKMGRVFTNAYAPSTLGSFLRTFTFGHVRQLNALASRPLIGLAAHAQQIGAVGDIGAAGDEADSLVLVDIDDTIVEVHGHAKQGSGYGYSGVRGLNALLATVTTSGCAPVIVAQRLRKGSCGSPLGAKRLVADALKTVQNPARPLDDEAIAARRLGVLRGDDPAVRQADPLPAPDAADPAGDAEGAATVGALIRGGADVSVTVRLDPTVKNAIAALGEDAWIPIEYTDAVYDEQAHYSSTTRLTLASKTSVPDG